MSWLALRNQSASSRWIGSVCSSRYRRFGLAGLDRKKRDDAGGRIVRKRLADVKAGFRSLTEAIDTTRWRDA